MIGPTISATAFESVIEAHLLTNGYAAADRGDFDRSRAIATDNQTTERGEFHT